MVMYDNEFKTKGNKIWTKDKIEPQHMHPVQNVDSLDKRKVKPTYCQWSVGKFAEFFDQNLFKEIQISYKVRRVTSHINSVDM